VKERFRHSRRPAKTPAFSLSKKNMFARLGKNAAFTLIELLVVIAILSILLAVIVPALRKAKESAKAVVCRTHLKTLALANELYAARCGNWYVPAIDTTMTARGEPTWNSNVLFRELVGLQSAYVGSSFVLPKDYLCPSDTQSNETYWNQAGITYANFVSYGCNLTDWGPDSRRPVSWSGNLPVSTWSCRFRIGTLRTPAEAIMFADSGDIWIRKAGADYKTFWNQFGQDIVKYRARNMWHPVYYRHKEGANVSFFDGHVEYIQKQNLFFYKPNTDTPDDARNNQIWFCIPQNRP
jgi:prepilin-type N-terminal cleavage/methylation domain-containing protein/prepilin-type processing-associated H-X9-DG protein